MDTKTVNPVGIQLPEEAQKEQINKEQLIQQMLLEEKKRLEAEYGVENKKIDHFKKPFEKAFTKDQRANTTILFGGLTWKHEKLIKGALEGIGYKMDIVPTADKKAFQLGKEYGNNGQCNPTYFTVGNLVQYLQSLEEKGMTKEEIIENHVFFTAGACGPCRFGMYEAEYRLALRNSGFDGFRVLLFQQTGGLSQQEAEAGLEMNLDFFLGIINAMMLGDIINEIGYHIRPYEVNEGETNKVMEEVIEIFYEKLKSKRYFDFNSRIGRIVQKLPASDYLTKFIDQILQIEHHLTALTAYNRTVSMKVSYGINCSQCNKYSFRLQDAPRRLPLVNCKTDVQGFLKLSDLLIHAEVHQMLFYIGYIPCQISFRQELILSSRIYILLPFSACL